MNDHAPSFFAHVGVSAPHTPLAVSVWRLSSVFYNRRNTSSPALECCNRPRRFSFARFFRASPKTSRQNEPSDVNLCSVFAPLGLFR